MAKYIETNNFSIAHHANDPATGLALNMSLNSYKLFLCDTGLFVTLAFKDKDITENLIYQKLLSDKDVTYLPVYMTMLI